MFPRPQFMQIHDSSSSPSASAISPSISASSSISHPHLSHFIKIVGLGPKISSSSRSIASTSSGVNGSTFEIF